MKNYLIKKMETYLENMCGELAIGNKDLFRYYAGKADALRDVLEEQFGLNEHTVNEHIKAMWDIMDENW